MTGLLLDIDTLKIDNFSSLNCEVRPSTDITIPRRGGKILVPGKESRVYYRSQNMASRLSLGAFEAFSVVDQTFELALTPECLQQAYGDEGHKLLGYSVQSLMEEGGYVDLDSEGRWWIPSSQSLFSNWSGTVLSTARNSFFIPTVTVDPFGNKSIV